MKPEPNFFYLNIGNRWPKFALTDLEIAADGALQLRALPRALEALPDGLDELPIPDAPAGIAKSEDGTIFFTEPGKHRLWRIDVCDPGKKAQPAPCIGGEGSNATQFESPRGLLFLPRRGLLIADSGNNRIQIMDPLSMRVREIWHGVNEPWTLAADRDMNVYVVVHGDRSLQKLNRWGTVDSDFRANIEARSALSPPDCALSDPVAAAIARIDGEEHVLVLDRDLHAIVVFSLDGQWERTFTTDALQKPLTLAVSERAIYIGDNGDQHLNVLQFELPSLEDIELTLVGSGIGYHGPIAALFADCEARALKSCHPPESASAGIRTEPCNLLLLAGEGVPPLVLHEGSGNLASGFAIAGPFDHRRRPVDWHRLQAFAETLPPHGHVRFFFLFDSKTGEPPALPPITTASSLPEDVFEGWFAFPPDVTDGFFESFAKSDSSGVAALPDTQEPPDPSTSTYLWLGLKLSGDGTASPRIHQIRLQFDHKSYLPQLPELYSDDRISRQFMLPLLSLFESFFGEAESTIAGLTALFDPNGAPADFLDWLAGWLAQDLKEEWSDDRKRRMIAKAFAAYAKRGTASGLRERLQDFTGVQSQIIEPALNSNLWSLGEVSTLNFDTMLAPAEAQGAVLGTTATLDHSHLITEAEYGAPLFDEVAHRFTVAVYPNAVSTAKKRAEVTTTIERDKPAHTAYQLCVIQPGIRVGFQSMVGIDTVVGGPEPATPLAEASTGGLILAGTPLARLGEGSQIGINTELY
jgi:phage tail-like protein